MRGVAEPYFVGSRHDLSKCQCTLDDLYETGRILLPDVVKMDIEGGEVDALQGMERNALHRVPQTFVECHLGPEVEGAVLGFLSTIMSPYDIQNRLFLKSQEKALILGCSLIQWHMCLKGNCDS